MNEAAVVCAINAERADPELQSQGRQRRQRFRAAKYSLEFIYSSAMRSERIREVRVVPPIAVFVVVLLGDQWSKHVVLGCARSTPRWLRPGLNRRLPSLRLMFVLWAGAAAAVILLVTRDVHVADHQIWVAFGLGAALGGASSNLLDRVRHGGVIDFIRVPFWPVFNPADLAITVGVSIALVAFF